MVLADDAYDVLLVNLVTSPGSQNCDPSVMGAGPRRTMAAATAESCSTNHQTPPAPTPPPTPSPTPSPTAVDPPTWSGGSGDIGLPGTGFPLATLLLWVAGLTLLGSLVLLLTRRRRAAAEGAEGADGPG